MPSLQDEVTLMIQFSSWYNVYATQNNRALNNIPSIFDETRQYLDASSLGEPDKATAHDFLSKTTPSHRLTPKPYDEDYVFLPDALDKATVPDSDNRLDKGGSDNFIHQLDKKLRAALGLSISLVDKSVVEAFCQPLNNEAVTTPSLYKLKKLTLDPSLKRFNRKGYIYCNQPVNDAFVLEVRDDKLWINPHRSELRLAGETLSSLALDFNKQDNTIEVISGGQSQTLRVDPQRPQDFYGHREEGGFGLLQNASVKERREAIEDLETMLKPVVDYIENLDTTQLQKCESADLATTLKARLKAT